MTPFPFALVVLAAGLSRRFGIDDKLLLPIAGRPLAAHVAAICGGLPFARRVAVVSDTRIAAIFKARGFEIVDNTDPSRGQGHSLARGLSVLAPATPVMIALADMPFVTEDHFRALAAAFTGDRPVCSIRGDVQMPPAIFPRAGDLSVRESDQGARAALRDAVAIPTDPDILRDIDRLEDAFPPPGWDAE